MTIVLLGPPGAGKGTQAEFITKALGIPSISTGNLLRAARDQGTALGEKVAGLMSSGQLVPDEVVIELVKERLAMPDCGRGVIFDGFPRTPAQAEALDRLTHVDMALLLDVSDKTIVERMSGRRTCPKCQATYHVVSNPPKVAGICDRCGAELVIRQDDKPEVVLQRLQVYHSQTEPVRQYYQRKGILKAVNGDDDLAVTTARVAEAIGVSA